MKKMLLVVIMFMMFPITIFALEDTDGDEIVSMTEKYYKTTTLMGATQNYSLNENHSISYTEEISKEEYDAYQDNKTQIQSIGTVETNYKKLKTYITQKNSYYRYTATLEWKNFPKVRSYDTIAIGHYASVKIKGQVQFSQTYCDTSGNCKTVSAYQPRTFTAGSSASFKLPTGDLSSLTQTIYFDVEKAVTDAKVIKQNASGDYAHSIKSINLMTALSHTVSNSGISYVDDCKSYFDDISVATATWEGSW